MADQWFVGQEGKRFGPFTAEQLRKLASSGQIQTTDQVWKEGMAKWVAASKVKGLFPEHGKPDPPGANAAKQQFPPPLPPSGPNQPAAVSPPPKLPSAPNQPTTASPTTHQAQDQRIATWVFGSILLTFFLGVFLFAPKELPEFKQRMLAFSSALIAGLFGFFFTGQMNLELKVVKQRFGDLGVKATGGAALFVLVLIWWLSPFAPVKPQLALKPIQYFAAANQISVMDKDVASILYSFDGKSWTQAEGFSVTPMGFVGVEHASARLNPEEKARNTKVFIKYLTRDGTESPVKEIAYDPNKSVYPESIIQAQKEAEEGLSRAMRDINKSIRSVSEVMGDQNTSHVEIKDRRLSRSDLAKLGKNSQLMTLALIRCEFDDADLEALEPADMLKSLSLSGSTVSDEGLKYITKLRFVTGLVLSDTKITDQGILYLNEMNALRSLNLDNTDVTGTGFARYYKFLSRLSLRGSKLNDDGAKYLGTTEGSHHSVASELDLGQTGLTDTGLKHLETCTQFQKLKIDGAKVTADGIVSLKKKFPHLKVEW